MVETAAALAAVVGESHCGAMKATKIGQVTYYQLVGMAIMQTDKTDQFIWSSSNNPKKATYKIAIRYTTRDNQATIQALGGMAGNPGEKMVQLNSLVPLWSQGICLK